jgi:2-oxoglutarate dehydrogenase E1 component
MDTSPAPLGTLAPTRPAAASDPATADAFRRWGYLAADLDPLGRRLPPERDPDLPDPADPAFSALRRAYCGPIGVEFMHIPDPARRRWVAERMEGTPGAPEVTGDALARALDEVIRAETFEQVLQARYLGTKRFSIEGVASLIPLLSEMLEGVARQEGEQVVLAMSHRGRLNVMLHPVGRPAFELFAGFEDVDPRSILGGGDVKYHMGATGTFRGRNGREVFIHLVSNPSHLEAVDPIALGRTRAKQVRIGDELGQKVVPILLHGDAAFAGQGILAEVLNLSALPGFAVGGTVHVIVNNLIGFTAEPRVLHSSPFASDVAKRLPIPIFHVNGEDARAVLQTAALAIDYRCTFGEDVVVDLIGYRRHGHSEVEDPTVTQPLLYKEIERHPPLWKVYAQQAGLDEAGGEARVAALRAELDQAQKQAKAIEKKPTLRTLPAYWDAYVGGPYKPEYEVPTGVGAEEIARLTERLTAIPPGFTAHEKIKKLLAERAEMGQGQRPIDYGMAEALAFGSLLIGGRPGTPIRFSGQDSRRGTFNQRHSVLIDVQTGAEFMPLQHLAPGAGNQPRCEIYDSMLSEAAVLGYEYGYSRDYPETLVLWEAQFGDFANGAQIIIDQFITAGEDKWGLLSGLVLLLPHGYEGQGAEHSSARMERYLQLAAEDNIQVCQPSTAAQYFHLLRRQALRKWRKPLVVLTPKSMLRQKDAASTVADLGRERFLPVVGEAGDFGDRGARRLLLCTGKIGHELKRERDRREQQGATAVVFLDQLYPFPEEEVAAELARHPEAQILWVQEEPANMGALFFVLPHLQRLAGRPVRTIKRSASGSPATGSAKAHSLEQKALLTLAFAS